MISINQNKHLRSLHRKKKRDQLGQFLIEGTKMVEEALHTGVDIEKIFATSEWIGRHIVDVDKVVEASSEELEKVSQLSTANQVIAMVNKKAKDISLPTSGQWYLGLEGVRDPGNMGTIIRTADWFGIDTLFLSKDCVEIYNPKVSQATMGSIFRVRAQEVDLLDTIQHFLAHNIPVYATSLAGDNIHEVTKKVPGLILMGNESQGLSYTVLEKSTHQLLIPSFGHAESLNVAIAAGIVMAWARR